MKYRTEYSYPKINIPASTANNLATTPLMSKSHNFSTNITSTTTNYSNYQQSYVNAKYHTSPNSSATTNLAKPASSTRSIIPYHSSQKYIFLSQSVIPITPTTGTISQVSQEAPSTSTIHNAPNIIIPENQSTMRPVSEILSPTDSNNSDSFVKPHSMIAKKQKSRKENIDNYVKFSNMVKNLIDNHNPAFSLNSQQLEQLLEETHGSKDVLITAKDYTTDPSISLTILEVIHLLLEKKAKGRCTRIKRNSNLA
ncbi:unnamed protein product [Psylliodes chrysocephalus]|uniref:Uncharacterized protein n=1 Tax=Psylliodes chrysocephalus TaxID=3402493 RepID=A0A9P0GMN2_9CUCU|nr:unnamed protein product [Psylliodes chrysocephala]